MAFNEDKTFFDMKKKLIVFHPAIAPYRVDFFNSIDEIFDAKFYFEFDNALEQTFDQKRLQEYLSFIPKYLSPGFLGIIYIVEK